MKLSNRQLKEAQRATDRLILDGRADVTRGTSSNTPTGRSKTPAAIYSQIPCHIAPVSESAPTVDSSTELAGLEDRGYAWFPVTFNNASVDIRRGDIITMNGQNWMATTDMDPLQGNDRRRRVRVHRPYQTVTA